MGPGSRFAWPGRRILVAPSQVVFQDFARFMPDCGRKVVLPTTKNMGGNHDKSNQFARPARRRFERARPPHPDQRRGGARRNGRDGESGLCGNGGATRPNRRSNAVNGTAALGPAPGKPLSGFPSGVRQSQGFVRAHRLPGLRRHHGG